MSGKLIIVAGPTASGKSALALAIARRIRRHGHQCRQHAGLSRPARPDGAARTMPPWPRRPHRLYGILDGARTLLGRALGRPGAGRDRGGARRPAGCRSWSAAPASICARCCRASPPCRRSPRTVREAATRAPSRDRRRGVPAELALLDPAAADKLPAGRQPAPGARLRGRAGDRALAGRLAARRRPRACRATTAGSSCSLPPRDALYAACDGRLHAMIAAGAPGRGRGAAGARPVAGPADDEGGRRAASWPAISRRVLDLPSRDRLRRSRRPATTPSGRSPGSGTSRRMRRF